MAAITVPSREGRAVVRYRTWQRACVGGLIERQRPMRKGKKIKRGRKRKHLGVLDILSAPNTHPRHGKTPWMGFTIQLKREKWSRLSTFLDRGWERRSNRGWIKAWKQYPVPRVSESQIWVPFCSWKCSSDVWRKTEREGGRGRQNKQQLR